MEKDFNTGLRRSLESDRIKLTRRCKQLLREMGYSEDLDSAEITEKLHEQVRANDVLNRSIARQEAETVQKKEEIAALQSKVKELERQLGVKSKPIAKTSANSSIPPSKNPIGVPHTQSQRKPSGKKTGGQKGHPGSTRLQTDDVTATERWYPAAVCPVCGKPLDMDSATVSARRQEVDIPLPIEAKVIDHLLMQIKCSCGHCCKGQFPESVNAPVNYGPNIMALVSYLGLSRDSFATYRGHCNVPLRVIYISFYAKMLYFLEFMNIFVK